MNRKLIVSLFALALMSVAEAQTTQVELTQAEMDQLTVALSRGKEIYFNDQAAWHVSDALVQANPGDKARPVVGWVTQRVDDEHVAAIFVRRDGETVREFFSGVTKGSKLVSSVNRAEDAAAPALDPRLLARFQASATAASRLNGALCGRRPNYVVLPSDTQRDGWDVYAIVPEQVTGEIAMAGHARVTVTAGGDVADVHEYSSTCLIGQKTENTEMVYTSVPAERGLLPTEMHVFTALTHALPIYVVTADNRVWYVDGHRIMLPDISSRTTLGDDRNGKPPN